MSVLITSSIPRTWLDTRSTRIECPSNSRYLAHEMIGSVWLYSLPEDDLHPLCVEGSRMIIRACGPFDLEPGKPFELKSDMGVNNKDGAGAGIGVSSLISGVDSPSSDFSHPTYTYILENKTDATIHVVKGQPVFEVHLSVQCDCGNVMDLSISEADLEP